MTGKCDVCEKESIEVGVCAVPGIPMSCAFCDDCLSAGAIPYYLAVANTACVGGYDESAEWWREVVDMTLKHLNISREEFDRAVKRDMEVLESYGSEDEYDPCEDECEEEEDMGEM